MTNELPNTSKLLEKIKDHKGESISFGELVERLREGGFALLLIIFSSPTALPLPAMGIATVLSVPIMLISIQILIGKSHPWLPNWLRNKKIKMSSMIKIINKINPYIIKVESLLKPRISFLSTKIGHHIIGLACVICALSVALPLPFTNTIPSIGILIMAIGLLERDGLAIIGGMIVGAIGIAFAITVYLLGIEVLKAALLFWQ